MQKLLFIDHELGLKPGEYPLPGTPYSAVVADGISDAIDKARDQRPGLLILNPKTVGAGQLLAMQETHRGWKAVPVVVYTDDPADRVLFPFGQVEAVVVKKEGVERLLETVDEILNGVKAV